MKLSLRSSFYIILVSINSLTSGMQFSGPTDDQRDSFFSQLPLDTQIRLASYTNARSILNLQQTCRLWYCTLNNEIKKQIVAIRNWPDISHIGQELYDNALAATLANFTTPESIPLPCKEPELFLLTGANPNYILEINDTSYTSTGLFIINSKYACTDEIKKVLKALIHHGADVNVANSNAYSTLHRAVRADATEMVAYLLDQKAHINQKDFDGNTALHHAATNLSYPMVKLLLDNNAEANLKNHKGNTAQQELEAIELYNNNDIETFFKIDSLFNPTKNSIPKIHTVECSQQ